MKISTTKSTISITSATIAIPIVIITPIRIALKLHSGFQNQSENVSGFEPIGESEKSQNHGISRITEIGRFIITAEVPFNFVDT